MKYHKNTIRSSTNEFKILRNSTLYFSVIISATMEQLKTNIESVNINLTKEIINEINEIQKFIQIP